MLIEMTEAETTLTFDNLAAKPVPSLFRGFSAPVTLDPFPGSIGGHVGGTVDINLPFDQNAKFLLTLTNIHRYVSGSGKNRSRQEKARWQDVIVAHAEPGSKGTRLTFRFDVPEGLQGLGITFITVGLMSLGFMGLGGIQL